MKRAAEFVGLSVEALTPLADEQRAAGMAAYMRGQFLYLGIATPVHRALIDPLIRAFEPESAASLREAVDALWKKPEREFQYVGLGLIGRHQANLGAADIPWLLGLVQRKSWWDTVDSLAKPVGAVVRRTGAKGRRHMDRAVRHKNKYAPTPEPPATPDEAKLSEHEAREDKAAAE